MAYLLFPGRHLLNTKFQETYVDDILQKPISDLEIVGSLPQSLADQKIDTIIFAVTSFNQSHSRYNPIPAYLRAINLDRFARQFKEKHGIDYKIIGIPHFNPTDKFVDHLIKEVYEQSEGQLSLSPHDTCVLCSTPALIQHYTQAGYAVLPAEYDFQKEQYIAEAPIDIIKKVVAAGSSWNSDQEIRNSMADTTATMWEDFPDVAKTVIRLWKDPLLTDSGSLTKERNYSTYAYEMNNTVLMDIKYADIKDGIVPGKIVDEGCADAALIVRLAEDFPDSDIIGIEITTEFTARCQERMRAGEFGGTFVHFHQRNLFDTIFTDNSIDTTICNSTTHELWSYGDKEKSIHDYLLKKYRQTRAGGHIVIRDVVGPEDKEREVYMKLAQDDGVDEDIFKVCDSRESLQEHLAQLSTYGRFLRFAEDFLKDMRISGKRGEESKIIFREESVDGQKYIVLRLKDAVEFMTKKDFINNWNSELNEEFAYWSFSEWKQALINTGFTVLENESDSMIASRSYTSEWIVDNRWKGKVELYDYVDGELKEVSYPPTHMVLIGEKR